MIDARAQALNYLRMLQRSGLLVVPAVMQAEEDGALATVLEVPVIQASREELPTPKSVAKQTPEPPTQSSPADDKAQRLEAVVAQLGECNRCKLREKRTKVVPGEGNADARIVFVGEAPGLEEDRSGRPFVGPAGELLDRMILAMHFHREDVFILNVVKCRPPENRNPQPDEMDACEPFLSEQLRIIQPRIIVTLGKFASQRLLNVATPISRLRGRWMQYNGIPLMPTYHPSYLLRSPSEKRLAWDDLQKVMAEYERLVGPLPQVN